MPDLFDIETAQFSLPKGTETVPETIRTLFMG